MIDLLRRAWNTLDTFKQVYPENWHEEDEQVLDDLMQADLNLSGGEFDRFIPPQREWVGLTTEEVRHIVQGNTDPWCETPETDGYGVAEMVEAKLREKNGL